MIALALWWAAVSPTRFQLINERGVDWIVRPDGRRLWSFGVCCLDQGEKERAYKPDNPSYAAYRYYPNSAAWASDTLDRLGKWGFNTVGAWSDDAELQRVPNQRDIVFTPILHIGSSAGAPWRDMWDPATVKLMDGVARAGIAAHHGDPRVMGYFSDNEQGWWYGAMWEWAFKAGPRSRGHVVDLLERTYHFDWTALKRDFDPDGAAGFPELRTKGRLYLRPGGNGIHTVQAWMGIVSDRYYSLCRSLIKHYDPGALYLGDRYISNFYPEIARSAGHYCDIVSTNLNADDNRGDFADFYLRSLHKIAKRPLMITEYYVAAKENRSGNQNNSSGFPVVETQRERAEVFARQTASLAQTPYVVGAHWFQYYDEPKKGRGDGENYDMGLVDTANRPYKAMIDEARDVLREGGYPKANPFLVSDMIPYPLPGLDRARLSDAAYWMYQANRIPDGGSNVRGDLYAGHIGNDLYLAVYWNEDRFAEAFYREGKVPAVDFADFSVQVDGQTTSIPFGEGNSGGAISTGSANIMATHYGVRNFAVIALPGKAAHRASMTLTTRARAYRMEWELSGPPDWAKPLK